MKKFKKIVAMCLTAIMALSAMSVCAFASTDVIPDDLPEGTVKIAEGIYAYTSPVMPINDSGYVNIGIVPAFGNIIQPAAFNNIVVETNHNYIRVQASDEIRINFVRGTQSVFGANLFDWPSIGGSIVTTYYIEADYYNIQKGVPYQLQCTSTSSLTRNVDQIRIWSTANGR